nr:galactoside alpha-(1,2)-fucosyltransferase 1-like isoform X2 [Cherax quadricarinatus]
MPVVGELKEPVLVLEAGARVRYNITWHGYTTPVLTFVILGRLGNTMGVYASLWAVARIYDTQVFMEKEVEKLLKPMFPHLTMSPLPVRMVGGTWLYVGRGSPCLADYTSLQEAAAGLRGARAIVVDDYPFEMQIFNAFRDDLLMEFTFSHQLQQEKLFKISPPGLDYLRRALTFYRQRLPRVTFVVASDDQDYVMDALGQELDVVFTQGFPPELDLAVLVACNHTIITMGSFGFWAGYLAGGAVVYPDLQPKMNEYSFSRIFYERANLTQFIPLPP